MDTNEIKHKASAAIASTGSSIYGINHVFDTRVIAEVAGQPSSTVVATGLGLLFMLSGIAVLSDSVLSAVAGDSE